MIKKASKYLFYFLALFLIFITAAEILFSIIFYIKDDQRRQILIDDIRDEPYLYYTFEKYDYYKNPDGFENNYTEIKPPGKYRVGIIGASVAEWMPFEKEGSRVNFFEKELNKALNTTNIEVFNAGLAGYVVEQEFIQTQLYLRKYNCDLIFSLDGYNDMRAFFMNRHFIDQPIVPPFFYREFKVLEIARDKNKFMFRFRSLFKSCNRAYEFFKNYINKKNEYDYSDVKAEDMDKYAAFYTDVLQDINALCKSRNCNYVAFLQPCRFYDKKSPGFIYGNDVDEKFGLMYNKIENNFNKLPFGYSLAELLNYDRSLFIGDCHVTKRGNRVLANEIIKIIAEKIKNDERYLKIVSEKN